MTDVPHFRFPFERGTDGKVRVVEQDELEHVVSCENVIVRCPVGFRQERPEFGIPWSDYRSVVDPAAVEEAVRRFEPRGTTSAMDLTAMAQASIGGAEIELDVEA